MEDRGQKDVVSRVISTFRRITKAVQLLPFAYLLVFALSSITNMACGDGFASLMDVLLYYSPAVSAALLILSSILRLCAWHKIASIIPSSSIVVGVADNIVVFTQGEIAIINVTIGLLSILFIFMAKRAVFGK